MSKLAELENLLSECAKKLEGAASLIKESELDSSACIQDVGAALTHIFAIQQAIYKIEPELEPGFLKVESLHSKHNKLLTTAMANAASLCDDKLFEEAIELFKEFLATDPPRHLAQMAESRIEQIKGITNH